MYYQVYCVDTYFNDYGIEYNYVGAESPEDLITNAKKIFTDLSNAQIKQLSDKVDISENESEYWRIKKVDNMFTDTPYKILDIIAYIE